MQDKLFQKEIGQRIKELRNSYGYTQDKLAEMVDLTTDHIRSMEAGRRGVTAETLSKLKRVFNVSADYLLTGSDNRNDISRLQEILSGVDSSLFPFIEESVILMIQVSNLKISEKPGECGYTNAES